MLRTVYMTIADQVVAEARPSNLDELTDYCIHNNIVYPDPSWDASGLRFTGWIFNDKSRIMFDDNGVAYKSS